MSANIQYMLDSVNENGTVQLPVGEFQGPFYVKKPCTVIGSGTTLWNKQGPVLVIESSGVTLKHLRIEVTQEPLRPEDFICLVDKVGYTVYENVEILGNVQGVPGEEGLWDIPKVIELGSFPKNTEATFTVEVMTPVELTIHSMIEDVHISPSELTPGKHTLTIKTNKLKEDTFLYGEILFKSTFTRRSYLNGSVKDEGTYYQDNRSVYKAKESSQLVITPMIVNPNVTLLKRGQRVSVQDLADKKITLRMHYSTTLREMEIDPYVFLLDEKAKVINEEDFVFFGNPSSKCGSIHYFEQNNEKYIEINLKTVPSAVQTISIAYSIYGDNPNFNFSKVVDPSISIFADDEEKMRFSPDNLLLETTIILVEFYRYNNEWKLKAVGAGYRDGLKRLCESYGLTVL